MKSTLLDTNCYSFLISGDRKIRKAIKQAETVYMSAVVLGELFAGFEGGDRRNENIELLANFISKPEIEVMQISQKTAQVYGKLSFELNRKGTPIPTNDIWIASQAVETDSTLITYDSHFLKIKGLRLWSGLNSK